ncbi:MAG TPA: hypothetical protein VFR07_02030 [Mycobacteriales bacterium]|jgi:hypothetical protein|nr:hypothetical protein [Mycobacteriales bacterium]
MTAHLDLDGLCDLLAGEGEQTQLGHVARCPECSQALADLEQAQEPVRAALAALPLPEVPADLTARLDAALLRAREQDLEAPARPVAGRVVALGAARSATRQRAGSRRGQGRRAPSWLLGSAAAAVVVVLTGAAIGVARMAGSGSQDSSTAASDLPAPASGEAGAGAAAVPVPAPVPVAASSTGTDYAGPAELAAALPRLLRGSAPAAGPPSGTGDAADPLARLHTPEGLADCLAGLPGQRSAGPVALDYARYAGEPALVVVLPGRAPDRVDVVVVAADCRAADGHTLLAADLPRS